MCLKKAIYCSFHPKNDLMNSHILWFLYFNISYILCFLWFKQWSCGGKYMQYESMQHIFKKMICNVKDWKMNKRLPQQIANIFQRISCKALHLFILFFKIVFILWYLEFFYPKERNVKCSTKVYRVFMKITKHCGKRQHMNHP